MHAADLRGYLRRIAGETPAVPPGRTLYSDLGYIVLGALLERVGGRPLDRLFADRIAGPLGLRSLGFGEGRTFSRAAATECGNHYERALAGAEGEGHGWRQRIEPGEVHDANAHGLGGVAGHAGLFGTAADVALLAHELLEPRRLPLDERARELLLGWATAGGRTLGMVTAAHSSAARGVLDPAAPGHTGFTGTSLWLEPRAGRIYVLLTNRVHPRVAARDFQRLRRGFHRLARRTAMAAAGA